ncbi:MAG: alpha/beta fold hydrolase [Pseudomonadales bacterium]
MKVKKIPLSCGTRLVITLLAISITSACAGPSPTARFAAFALESGLEPGDIAGLGFRHRTFAADPDAPAAHGQRLHVYFGGDGTPFLGPNMIAADPTPREPFALKLMRLDPKRSVFLGRPCYHGMMAGCEPGMWTIGRYSEAMVASMAAATERLIAQRDYASVVLIGYSGGGVLALLVAERLPQVDAVVTVAANLDLQAWTELHGYSPLVTSLDPARLSGSRNGLRQLHLSGEADGNVPPAVHEALLQRLPAAEFRTLPGFDHRCCWLQLWPQLLAELDSWPGAAINERR